MTSTTRTQPPPSTTNKKKSFPHRKPEHRLTTRISPLQKPNHHKSLPPTKPGPGRGPTPQQPQTAKMPQKTNNDTSLINRFIQLKPLHLIDETGIHKPIITGLKCREIETTPQHPIKREWDYPYHANK